MYTKLFKNNDNNKFIFKNNREFLNLISIFNPELYNVLLEQIYFLFNSLINFTFDFIFNPNIENKSRDLDYVILKKILKSEILNYIKNLKKKQYLIVSKNFKIKEDCKIITVWYNALLSNEILFCLNNQPNNFIYLETEFSWSQKNKKDLILDEDNYKKISVIKNENFKNFNIFLSRLDLKNLNISQAELFEDSEQDTLIQISDLLNLYELTYKIITNIIVIPSFYKTWEESIFNDITHNKIVNTIKFYDKIIENKTQTNKINESVDDEKTNANILQKYNLYFCNILLDFIELKKTSSCLTNKTDLINIFNEEKDVQLLNFNKFINKFINNSRIEFKSLPILLNYSEVLNKKQLLFWIDKINNIGEIKFFIYNYKIIVKIFNHELTVNDFNNIKLQIKNKLKNYINTRETGLNFYPIHFKYDGINIENKNKTFSKKNIEELIEKINNTKNIEICFYYKLKNVDAVKNSIFNIIKSTINEEGVNFSIKQIKLLEYYQKYNSKHLPINNSHIDGKKSK